MPDRCTCGAVLPEDALFCHRCGKPQREILAVEPEPAPPAPPPMPDAALEPPPIGFHNALAVRIGLLVGVLSIIVSAITGQITVLQAVEPLWLIGAGFFAVFLYRRRTGRRLSTLSGAHLGWISGIFGFLIVAIMLTVIAAAMSEPAAVSAMRDQWSGAGRSEADLNRMIEALHSPEKIAVILATVLLLFSVLPAFGGALGAKLLDRAKFAGRE